MVEHLLNVLYDTNLKNFHWRIDIVSWLIVLPPKDEENSKLCKWAFWNHSVLMYHLSADASERDIPVTKCLSDFSWPSSHLPACPLSRSPGQFQQSPVTGIYSSRFTNPMGFSSSCCAVTTGSSALASQKLQLLPRTHFLSDHTNWFLHCALKELCLLYCVSMPLHVPPSYRPPPLWLLVLGLSLTFPLTWPTAMI